jgi:IS30 family transposase
MGGSRQSHQPVTMTDPLRPPVGPALGGGQAVSGEVHRNGGRCGYRASRAQRASDERARRPKARKLMVSARLAEVVSAVYECLLEVCRDLPDLVRRSLTWDQGRDTAQWPQLQLDADIEVYSCRPCRCRAA